MVISSEWLERYRRDPKCWPCCRCKRNGQHKNQRFNATSLSSDKIKKTSSSSVPSDCDSSTVFCRLSYRSILSISSFIQWRCVWSAKKYVETSHLSPRSSLHILSSGICPNGSSIFVFLWLLAMVPRAYPESQIENQEKKIDWYSPRTESKISSPWARFTYLKKTIPHFLLLIEDGSEGAAIWLFPCWIVQSSHAQSHQNEVHFNLKRLFSICLKELYVETGWNEYSAL